MVLDVILDMMNEHFQKFHFHIFIFNYFYLNNLYGRLPIFEAISQTNLFNKSKININYKEKNIGEIETNYSLNTLSNNSDEETVQEKAISSGNDFDSNDENLENFFRKYGIDLIIKEKNFNNNNITNELNKENIYGNNKF